MATKQANGRHEIGNGFELLVTDDDGVKAVSIYHRGDLCVWLTGDSVDKLLAVLAEIG